MTAESPSSKKVDDFLSLLSQLSQERLKQDQQRQRELERTIGDLRQGSESPIPISASQLTSSISKYSDAPLLKFNRNKYTDKTPPPKPTRPKPVLDIDMEFAPKLPQRRQESPPPTLPRRRSESPPPMFPKRKEQKTPPSKPVRKTIDYTINLVQPVARRSASEVRADTEGTLTSKPTSKAAPKVAPKIAPKPTLTTKPLSPNTTLNKKSTGTEQKFRTFVDVENTIKGDSKPLKPAKADWLTSSMTQSRPKTVDNVPKPSYLQALSASQNSKLIESSPSKETIVTQKFVPNATDVSIVSPTRERKSTSWIDSAISKSPTREKKTPPVVKSRTKDLNKALSEVSENETDSQPTQLKTRNSTEEVNKTKQPPAKPVKLSIKKPSYNDYKDKDNEMLLSQLAKIKKNPAPVVPKPAPKPKSLYEKQDTEELKSRIGRLSPTKGTEQSNRPLSKYLKEDASLLNTQINRLGKVETRPEIVKQKEATKTEVVKTEAKNAETVKPKVAKKPEIVTKPATAKPEIPKKPSKSNLTNPSPEVDFKSHLSSIIRAGTAPQIGATNPDPQLGIKRSDSSPISSKKEDTLAEGKLVHINKTRAKGPKRKLPKKLNTSMQPSKTLPTTNQASKPKFAENVSTSLDFKGDVFI